MWLKYGLKAQKLLAQGSVLGMMAISKAPCNYPGRCPGLGASALSGRVGQNLRKFSNLIIALQKLLLPRHFRH